MKFCTIAYLPPAIRFPTAEFKENLKQFKTRFPLLVFSESKHDFPGLISIPDPEPRTGHGHKYFTNNRIFLTAVLMAMKHGFTHFCYLEADCRVGRDYWDETYWEEFCSHPKPIVTGGTTVVYNPCNTDRQSALRWQELLITNTSPSKLPIATYGWKAANVGTGSCVFVNGALGIYSVSEMARLFDLTKTATEAEKSQPWDMEIGMRMWNRYGRDVYYLVGHLVSVFSGYGNVLSTEEDRLHWLAQGRFVAVHQVKGIKDNAADKHPPLER